MPKFEVDVTRTSHSTKTIEVEAVDINHASILARDKAGDEVFGEKEADYFVEHVRPLEEDGVIPLNWDQMEENFIDMLRNVEFHHVGNLFNRLAELTDNPRIECIYTPEDAEEATWMLQVGE